MVAISILGYALLGLIAHEPATGYELSKRLSQKVGPIWSANHSQAYPELRRLTEAGLLSVTETKGRGPLPTRTYTITDEGLTAAREWALGPPVVPQPRSPRLVQAYLAWLGTRTEQREHLLALRRQHEEKLAFYRQIETTSPPGNDDPGHPQFWSRMTLHAGISAEERGIAWCDFVLGRLDEIDARTDHSPADPGSAPAGEPDAE